MPFMDEIICEFPENLNASGIENEELEIAALELYGAVKLCWKKEKSSIAMAPFSY